MPLSNRAIKSPLRTCNPFNGQYTDDTQPVEHVVHGGCCESSPELVTFPGMRHGHDRVRHRRADVGAHDDEDGLTDVEHCRNRTRCVNMVPLVVTYVSYNVTLVHN